MKRLLTALALGVSLWGQQTGSADPTGPSGPLGPPGQAAATPAVAYPAQWYGAGLAYNPSGSPVANGWFSAAVRVTNPTTATGVPALYSFTTTDETFAKIGGKYQLTSSPRTGVGSILHSTQIGKWWVHIMAFGDAGAATTTSNLLGAFSGGGGGILQHGKWTFEVFDRVLKISGAQNQNVIEFGVGRTN